MRKRKELDAWADHEVFTQKGSRIGKPKVTIAANSTIHFNAGFIHSAKIAQKTHVLLGYSAEKQVITLQFTTDSKAEGALTIVHRQGGASVTTRSFFNYFFIKIENVVGKYEPKKVKIPKIGDTWSIDLSKKEEMIPS
jgi:hypothetical protein